MQFGFHTIHFSPMFGGDRPVLDVIAATAAARSPTEIGIFITMYHRFADGKPRDLEAPPTAS